MTTSGPVPFLAALTPAEESVLRQRARTRCWPRGAVLCVEGDAASWIAVLLTGAVKASHYTDDGREILLGVQGTGTVIGDVEATDGGPRQATVRTLTPVTALVASHDDFAGFLRAHDRVARLLARTLCARLRDADEKRAEHGCYDATRRIARRLAELAARFGEPSGQGVQITISITQDELGGWAGASREAAGKALQTLRRRGLIETGRRGVLIRDLAALVSA